MSPPSSEVPSRTNPPGVTLDAAYKQLALSMDELERLLRALNERLPGRGFDKIGFAIQSVRQVVWAAQGRTPSAVEALTCATSSLRLMQAALMELTPAADPKHASSPDATNIVRLELISTTR